MIELAETFTVNWGGAERVQRVRWKGWSEEEDDSSSPQSCSPCRRTECQMFERWQPPANGSEDSFLSLCFHLLYHQSAQGSPALPPQDRLTIYLSHIKTQLPTNHTFTPPHKCMSPLLSVLSMLTYSLRAHKGKLCTGRTYRHMDISM